MILYCLIRIFDSVFCVMIIDKVSTVTRDKLVIFEYFILYYLKNNYYFHYTITTYEWDCADVKSILLFKG